VRLAKRHKFCYYINMEIRKAYKVRLYPTQEQEQTLREIVGACRFVYNYYLEMRINAYMQTNETIPYAAWSVDLTKLRNDPRYPWLKEVNRRTITEALRNLDSAYNRFFRKQNALPRFKSRRDARQSFNKPMNWRIDGNRVFIQHGLSVKLRGTLPSKDAVLRGLTVSVTSTGKWYASMACTQAIELPKEYAPSIGIDLGLTHLAITSDGHKYDNPTLARKRAKRLKYLQQSLERKQRGSKRWEKARSEVARLHEKTANQRMNYLHQVSSAITSKNHALIAVEDLAVANMLKNRRLSRSIDDVSWSEFVRQIEYKQQWRSGQFFKVDRFFPSSKTCSNCSFVNQSMPLSMRHWGCPKCGVQHDRDVNAAQNILKQAEVQLGVKSTESKASDSPMVTGSTKRGHVLHDADRVSRRKENYE
jgi:putative transposase